MKREIIITGDGSHSIRVPELNVAYHSVHGAIQESIHVFINAGFYAAEHLPGVFRIFEVGFGTGLNALLTLIEAEKKGTKICYETIEPYPLEESKVNSLNYCHQLGRPDLQITFMQMHTCDWEKEIMISNNFTFRKNKSEVFNYAPAQMFNLVYFDAFAPNAQPEMWTKEVFDKMHSILLPGGILVTYCSKGDARRSMQAAGFNVEKLPGPLYKREMLRARKLSDVQSDR